ncbi:MAG: BrnT family toxin [Deltaproteobacteria bacterium]|nr:BrnT family toxin [Deltaproteobacteria bacterium]MBW2182006.1 BrnT family toxin [Deltaproteobacteria bacterium]
MFELKFEWDKNKDNTNQKKHRVSFSEDKTVFYDGNAIEFYDPDHSYEENRFILLGLSDKLRILVVSYLYKKGKKEDIIRIFSTRKATKIELKSYKER